MSSLRDTVRRKLRPEPLQPKPLQWAKLNSRRHNRAGRATATARAKAMTTATTPTNDHGKQVAVDLFRHSELEDVEDAYAEKEVGIEDLLLRPRLD